MSKRQRLLGVGVGIMIGASVLQLGIQSEMKQPSPQETVSSSPAQLTQQQVQQWLKENDYAFVKQREWETQLEKIKELEQRPPAPSITTIYINPGLSVAGLENLLVKFGLLPKDNHFTEMVSTQGLSRKIRSGVYTFKGKQTEESIIREITAP